MTDSFAWTQTSARSAALLLVRRMNRGRRLAAVHDLKVPRPRDSLRSLLSRLYSHLRRRERYSVIVSEKPLGLLLDRLLNPLVYLAASLEEGAYVSLQRSRGPNLS